MSSSNCMTDLIIILHGINNFKNISYGQPTFAVNYATLVHIYALQLLNDYAATLIIPVDMFHHPSLSPDATHIAELHRKADQFIAGGLTPSTIVTYSRKKKYIQFCTTHQVTPLPSSETTLILFASYLATTNISHTTCICQLSAICM